MKRAFTVIAAIACVLIAAHAEAVVRVIDEGTFYFYNGSNGGRSFARSVNGTLWCAYSYIESPGVNHIRAAYSEDGGVSWMVNYLTGPSSPLGYDTVRNEKDHQYPAVVTDGDGLVHFIWLTRKSDGTEVIQHACHWPGAWDMDRFSLPPVPGNFTPDPNGWEELSAALDSRGRIHAVWSQLTGGASTKLNVYYAVYSGGKYGQWSVPRCLRFTDDRDQLGPSIAVDPYDNVYVAYYGYPNDQVGEIKLLSGPNLDQLKSVSDSDYRQVFPCVACDAYGNVHVTWYGTNESSGASHDLYYRMRDAGGTWHDVEKVNNGPSYNHANPSVATDMNGKVYIVSSASMSGVYGYGVVLHSKFINDVGWGDASSLAIDEHDWATRDARALHAYWPLADGLPVNIPKAGYAYYFDTFHTNPDTDDADKFEVRAGIPDELTWMGQNYAELRIIPPTTGGFTYAPGEQVNLEWKVYPDAFTALKTPHNIYFGVWKDATVDGRSATVHEVGSSGRILLYEGTRRRWASFSPKYFAWKNVAFPLQGNVSSGTFHFTVPRGAQGRWAFIMAVVDPSSGSFIASPEIACGQYFWVE